MITQKRCILTMTHVIRKFLIYSKKSFGFCFMQIRASIRKLCNFTCFYISMKITLETIVEIEK